LPYTLDGNADEDANATGAHAGGLHDDRGDALRADRGNGADDGLLVFRAGSKATQFGSERAQLFHTARIAMQDIIQAIENLEWMPNTKQVHDLHGQAGRRVAVAGVHGGGDELEFVTSTSPTLINGPVAVRAGAGALYDYRQDTGGSGGSGAKTARSHLVKIGHAAERRHL